MLQEHVDAAAGEEGEGELECPEGFEWYLEAFYELSRKRQSNGYAPLPITWTELLSWMEVNRLALAPWETDVLMALDDVWLDVRHGNSRGTRTTDPESGGRSGRQTAS